MTETRPAKPYVSSFAMVARSPRHEQWLRWRANFIRTGSAKDLERMLACVTMKNPPHAAPQVFLPPPPAARGHRSQAFASVVRAVAMAVAFLAIVGALALIVIAVCWFVSQLIPSAS